MEKTATKRVAPSTATVTLPTGAPPVTPVAEPERENPSRGLVVPIVIGVVLVLGGVGVLITRRKRS